MTIMHQKETKDGREEKVREFPSTFTKKSNIFSGPNFGTS